MKDPSALCTVSSNTPFCLVSRPFLDPLLNYLSTLKISLSIENKQSVLTSWTRAQKHIKRGKLFSEDGRSTYGRGMANFCLFGVLDLKSPTGISSNKQISHLTLLSL